MGSPSHETLVARRNSLSTHFFEHCFLGSIRRLRTRDGSTGQSEPGETSEIAPVRPVTIKWIQIHFILTGHVVRCDQGSTGSATYHSSRRKLCAFSNIALNTTHLRFVDNSSHSQRPHAVSQVRVRPQPILHRRSRPSELAADISGTLQTIDDGDDLCFGIKRWTVVVRWFPQLFGHVVRHPASTNQICWSPRIKRRLDVRHSLSENIFAFSEIETNSVGLRYFLRNFLQSFVKLIQVR